MPRSRVSKRPRAARWPCGDCRLECTDLCVFCQPCKTWFHISCQGISKDSLSALAKVDEPFQCNSCLRQDIGPEYNFLSALLRLRQAAEHGAMYLLACAEQESLLLPDFSYRPSPVPDSLIDFRAKSILEKCKLSDEVGTPYMVNSLGNCLFNSVSVHLVGSENLASELRVRTCLEMVTNKTYYIQLSDAKDILMVSPDYDQACLDCAVDGGWSAMWTILALSTVIGMNIRSVYPPMNGQKDFVYKTLNRK